ncbi:MAG: hypothetical protein LBK56_09130 [Gracilibacteraceae bacterium]|jgi:hypothetical protein|nr:hypothetical protein [Gracilibacteraceae bacterium]
MKSKKPREMGKILPALCIALLLALTAAGCGTTTSAKTMLELNQEYSAMTVVESSGGVKMDITLSNTVNDRLGSEMEQLLDMFKQISYSSKSDQVNMTGDVAIQAGGSELLRLVMDGPGGAYYVGIAGFIDMARNFEAATGDAESASEPSLSKELAADLRGNQWIKFELPDDSKYLAGRELLADYLLGLDNEVFTDFDSGFVKAVSGGFEFKVTYEQLGAYVQSLGGYILENLDKFVNYTKTFLQGLTEEQMSAFGLTADMRDKVINELDTFVAPENKTLYENNLAMAVQVIQTPDVAKIFGGSYIDLKLTKSGETFTWACDLLVNLNFAGSSIGALFGVDFGDNSIRFTFDEQAKPLASFTPEIPASGVIDAGDTKYFTVSDMGYPMINPYATVE